MNTLTKQFLILSLCSLFFIACKKEAEEEVKGGVVVIKGCTDKLADNYNKDANQDEGCTYQKRYLGKYNAVFTCKSILSAVFTTAEISIIELASKNKVNIIIETNIGPLPVEGLIDKNTITINSTLTDLNINGKDINPILPEKIIADGTIKTVLKISEDNKILDGDLEIGLKIKSPAEYALIPVNDTCGLIATKK